MGVSQDGQSSGDAMVLITAEQARAGDAYALRAGDTPEGLIDRKSVV